MLIEKQLQNEILRRFGTLPSLRLWRSNSGVARMGTRMVRFGIVGQADISGIVLKTGQRLEIEVKSPTGIQSEEQQAFGRMIQAFNGIYVLARSVDDVQAAIGRYL